MSTDPIQQENVYELSRLNSYLSNERTFLAWIRTSIGIMAFGFVVEKFNLFLKQISFFLGSQKIETGLKVTPPALGQSSILGVILVGLGVAIIFLSYIKYKKVEKQIGNGTFRQFFLLEIILTLSLIAIGLFLMIFLIHSL